MADSEDLAEVVDGIPDGQGGRSRRKRIRWGINLAWFMGGIGVAGFSAGMAWKDFNRDMDTVKDQLGALNLTLNTALETKLAPIITRVAEHDIRLGNLERVVGQCCPAGRTSSGLWPCVVPSGALARK